MSRRREPCRNFQRGSCQYGDRCKFLHVSQQQSRPNSFGFGTQNTSHIFNTSQQQKPNPFGFGVQNSSGLKSTPSFGARHESPAKPFENKWIRPSSTTTTNSTHQASTQQQSANHQCTDPESCKQQIVEDFKNELPLWRLTCYGHWKNRPCDIVGDISYEELRAAAHEDARKGLPVQAIIERERNLYNSKCAEFDRLLRNPYVIPSPGSAQANLVTGASNSPSMGIQNNTPAQSNAPPLFSSFSQLGASTNFGSNVRPQAPEISPNTFFSQPNFPQHNGQTSGGLQMKFSNSVGTKILARATLGKVGPCCTSWKATWQGETCIHFLSTSLLAKWSHIALAAKIIYNLELNGLFGSQLPTQPSGCSPGSNTTNLQNGVMTVGSDRASSPSVPMQFPSSTDNQLSSFLDVPRAIPDAIHPAYMSEKQEDGPDDSVWLKKEWAVGEIPIVAPPERFCL